MYEVIWFKHDIQCRDLHNPFSKLVKNSIKGLIKGLLVERSVHNAQKIPTKELFHEVNCVIKFTEISYKMYHFEQTIET